VGFTTVRVELFVDDPFAAFRKALASLAIEHSPVEEHEHDITRPKPIKRMLQGALMDPFGQYVAGRENSRLALRRMVLVRVRRRGLHRLPQPHHHAKQKHQAPRQH
jgi:hypothetical protein